MILAARKASDDKGPIHGCNNIGDGVRDTLIVAHQSDTNMFSLATKGIVGLGKELKQRTVIDSGACPVLIKD